MMDIACLDEEATRRGLYGVMISKALIKACHKLACCVWWCVRLTLSATSQERKKMNQANGKKEYRKIIQRVFKSSYKQKEMLDAKGKTHNLLTKLNKLRQVEPEQLREPHNL